MTAALSLLEYSGYQMYQKEKEVKEIKSRTRINQQRNRDYTKDIDSCDNNENQDTDTRYYISVDIGKKNRVACIIDEEGMIIEETRYGNILSEAHDFAQHIDRQYNATSCVTVVEFTANMWIKTYKSLEQLGIQTKLANNPFKTRVIAEARIFYICVYLYEQS